MIHGRLYFQQAVEIQVLGTAVGSLQLIDNVRLPFLKRVGNKGRIDPFPFFRLNMTGPFLLYKGLEQVRKDRRIIQYGSKASIMFLIHTRTVPGRVTRFSSVSNR